jgi:hypothetical protein
MDRCHSVLLAYAVVVSVIVIARGREAAWAVHLLFIVASRVSKE